MHFFNSHWLPFIFSFVLFAFQRSHAQVYLFNGAQEAVLTNASSTCLSAFNTSLSCDSSVQYLSYDLAYLNWQTSNLTNLCTDECSLSLQALETAVTAACGTWAFDFNGGEMTAGQVMDLYLWKYNMSCLEDATTGSFCLIEEQSWNISSLNASGQATWPTYTNVTYPEYDDSTLGDFQYLMTVEEYGLKGKDYFTDTEAQPSDNGNYGVSDYLDYSEFPLEIQCSYCFLAQIKLGINSQWGEVYDSVMEQTWSNIQLNCDITDELTPANNFTGEYVNPGVLTWDTTICTQEIFAANTTTCSELALANNVASASIASMNDPIGCDTLANGTYCADEACQVAVVENATSARAFLASSASYENITLTQFLTWNTYIDMYNIGAGDVVCVGAPGGDYIPASTTVAVASPTVFTTTASPPAATPTGTLADCGKYYTVVSGDYCNLIAQANSLTLDDLYAMNPSLDACCSNLVLGDAYCVAAVQDAVVATLATTESCSYYTASTSGASSSATTATATTTSATATSATVAAPTQTRSGSTAQCYEWYTVQSGDGCWSIEQEYDITLAQFEAWNTDVDDECDGLWADYAYCVNGPPV